MDRERLQRIRNFQSEDWYAALIVRPITILVMLVIADWKFLTPNRLTGIANVTKLAGAWFILDPSMWWLAVVMLQLGLLFDHLDGTMARYRGTFTKLGSFYDKVSDIVTWPIIVMAAGWEAAKLDGEPYYLLLAAASSFALMVCGYMKWLAQAEAERVRWLEARANPELVIAKRTAPIVIARPPTRSARDWAVWFAKRVFAVGKFEEMDLWFWLSLALIIRRLDLGLWLLCITQVITMIAMTIIRGREMVRADARIRELEASYTAQASGRVS